MIFCPLSGRFWRRTQGFGGNADLYKRFGLIGHNGQDYSPFIPNTKGVIVSAPHDGWVTLGNEGKDGYGKYVMIISDPFGEDRIQRRSDLAHLESQWVKNGQFVYQGEPIGVMGNTGFSTGIHLHHTYKQLKDGKVLNYNNGYHGAMDIWKHQVYWNPTSRL